LVASVLIACGDKPAQAPPASTTPVAPVAPVTEPAAEAPPAAPPPIVAEPVHTDAPSAKPAAARVEKPHATKAAQPTATQPERETVEAEPKPAVSVAAAAAAGPCGDKGQPPCPLQGWMEHNLQQPLDAGDLAHVAAGLARLAHFAPDASWNAGATGWDKLATDATAAAKAGDVARVKQACKTCHKAWRAKYKASFRQRAVAD
jgi:hypothetical protein